MSSKTRPLGQGLPRTAEGSKEWRGAWRPLDLRDRVFFEQMPDAGFLFRWGLGRFENRRLVGVEIVYRSGESEFILDVPSWSRLAVCIEYARHRLDACPALAADATRFASGDDLPAEWLLMSDIDVYVDGDGSFRFGGEVVALRRFGDLDAYWRKRIEERRLYTREFSFRLSEVNLLVDDMGRPRCD